MTLQFGLDSALARILLLVAEECGGRRGAAAGPGKGPRVWHRYHMLILKIEIEKCASRHILKGDSDSMRLPFQCTHRDKITMSKLVNPGAGGK